ncbi:MAG: class I SAM-dependent methyltransferase [bacterium]
MKKSHLRYLQCQVCGRKPVLVDHRISGSEISTGKLLCETGLHFFPIVLGRPLIIKDNSIANWLPPINKALGINIQESYQDSLGRLGEMGIEGALSRNEKVKPCRKPFNDENYFKYYDRKILNKAKYRKSGVFFNYYNRMRFKKYSDLKFIKNSGNEMFNKFLDICLCLKPKKILDLASGSGSLLTSLVNNAKEIDFAYGVDNDIFCTWSLQYRLDHLKNAGRTEAFGADVRYLPFKNNLFDLVTCNVSLTEIQGISRLLSEAFRVLRTGGSLVICNLSEPFKSNYYQSDNTAWIKMKDVKKFCKAADLFFDFPRFNQFAEQIGFKGNKEFFFSRNKNDYFVKSWSKTI